MNDRVTLVPQACGAALAGDVRQCLERLLASAQFAKAPRMSRLLSFIVESKLCGTERALTEYAIGVALFGRDADGYSTALDPVVRVQIGRLRSRLASYYAALDRAPVCRISIPMGKYVPVFTVVALPQRASRQTVLQLAPLRNLTSEQGSTAFVCGLDEELSSRLFHDFGSAIALGDTASCLAASDDVERKWPHRLEGSIRMEQNHVRASMRLVDTRAGQIAWLSKFDFRGKLCMSLQERLAGAICTELQRYLSAVPLDGGPLPSWGSSQNEGPLAF